VREARARYGRGGGAHKADGKDIEKEDLPFVTNEWDEYAVEEAILIKERLGGTVVANSARR